VFSFVPPAMDYADPEVDRDPGCRSAAEVLRHLGPLIPRQRPAELGGQPVAIVRAMAVADRLGTIPGKRGPVLHANARPWPGHARQVEQEREPRGALHSVPMAELPSPRTRSPSQSRGTARSVASAGRWLIRSSGVTKGFPVRGCAPAARAAPARCADTPSAHGAARRAPAHTALGRWPRG